MEGFTPPPVVTPISAPSDGARAYVLSIEGDLSFWSAPHVQREILAQTADEPADVVLDCSRVDFVDVRGLAALLRVAERLRADDRKFALVRLGAEPQRLVSLVDLDGHLHLFDTVEQATRGLSRISRVRH